METPGWVTALLIFVQIAAVVGFAWLVWPMIRDEKWKEKFIKNKQALSLIIVFVLIFLFIFGMTAVFDIFFAPQTLY
jgi:predicted permease